MIANDRDWSSARNRSVGIMGDLPSYDWYLQEKHGPVGLVHIDAHSDTNDHMLGERIAHGTPFRRAVEDGCLVGNKVIQIGLRGSSYHLDDYEWGKQQVRWQNRESIVSAVTI